MEDIALSLRLGDDDDNGEVNLFGWNWLRKGLLLFLLLGGI